MSYRYPQILVSALLVFAVAVLVYVTSLSNRFAYDDIFLVKQNTLIRSLDNLPEIFSTNYWWGTPKKRTDIPYYRPLTVVSYALNYAIGKLNPFGYHLFNVIVHALNSVFVFFIGLFIFRQQKIIIPLIVGLLFAVHPIHTEAVANVVGRSELLYTFFFLLAWLLHIHLISNPGRSELFKIIGIVILMFLSFFSKEVSVTFFVVIVAFDMTVALQNSVKETLKQRYPYYILYVLVTLIYLYGRSFLVPFQDIFDFVSNCLNYGNYSHRLVNALGILFFKYIGLLFLPNHLLADYSYNSISLIDSWASPAAIFLVLMAIGALIGFIYSCKHHPIIAFCMLVFSITIFPVSNLVVPICTIMAERLTYLPSIGFCILMGYALMQCQKKPKLEKIGLIVALILICGYAYKTVMRNLVWHDDKTLFAQTVSAQPLNARMQYYMGTVFEQEKDYDKAIEYYLASLNIYPAYSEALYRLGNTYSKKGDHDKAIDVYLKLLSLYPNDTRAKMSLVWEYYFKGDKKTARMRFKAVADNIKWYARVAYEKNNKKLARQHIEQLLDMYTKLQDEQGVAWCREKLQLLGQP